jgi:hypothetical protein
MIGLMTDWLRVDESDGSFSCTFYCGELPADEAVIASGHEPNGYFWEGLVQYLAPDVAEQLELDSEGGMFAAYGDRGVVERLQALLRPYVEDGQRVSSAIRDAEAAGFQFDD